LIRDAQVLPFSNEVPDTGLGTRFQEAIRNYRGGRMFNFGARIPISERLQFANGIPQIQAPHRVTACSVRCDLDGFSAMVQKAFSEGPAAVMRIAHMFAEILEFGDQVTRLFPGAIQLPWAGDCATIVIPGTSSNSSGSPNWLEFA